MKSIPDPNNGKNVYVCKPDGSNPNEKICVTGECTAGMLPAKSDLRTQCEMEKDQCMFTCSISSAIGGGMTTKALGGGLIVGGAALAERKSLCNLICGIKHGF